MSFRFKTIIGIALIEFVLLMILILSGLNFLSESNEYQLNQRTQTTINLFSSATKSAILSSDLATLESIVDEMQKNAEVVYTRVSSRGASLAESGDKQALSEQRTIDTSYQTVDDNIFDIKQNIEVEGKVFATIELGISTQYIDDLLEQSKNAAFSLAAIEIILVAIFSFILGTYLTRQLNQLKDAARQIDQTGPGHQVDISSHDEIADVAKSFNLMSRNLENSYDDLKVSLKTHKQMIQEAHYNEAKIFAILESSLDANITINSKDKIVEFNSVAESIFGWNKKDILGLELNETIIPQEFRQAHNTGMAHFLKTGEGPVLGQRIELVALHKKGHTFPIEISISPIYSKDETLFTAFVRDLTQQKEDEQKHILALQQAEQANQAKSRFLATMSHEIRSPLNAIITMNALLFDTELNDKQLEMVKTVNIGGDILMSLINDILDFSKIESGKLNLNKDWFDLKTMVSDTIALLSSQTKDNIKIHSNISPTLENSYYGDMQRIRQILINLFSNAIKFTHHGYVQVDLDMNDDQHIELKVTDTGIGISENHQQSIFNEFQQVEDDNKRRFGGTGLGLSIVYRLIQMMDGSIKVSSQLEKGSCFKVILPLEGSETEIDDQAVDVTHFNITDVSNKNILLVEDSPTNQIVIKTLLQKLNLNVTCADNGKIAVALTKKNKYDLILMDLAMPEMNGFEATQHIRTEQNLNNSTQIIAITANAFDDDKEQCLKVGMNDFISKPIDIKEFHKKMPQWISIGTTEKPKDVLDSKVMEQLKKDTSAKSLKLIAHIFIEETQKREQTMLGYYADGNLSGLSDEAHTLKSSSASFGAFKLQQLAKEIEINARENKKDIIDNLMESLSPSIDDALESIKHVANGTD